MRLTVAPEAQEQLKSLPKYIQSKARRQFSFLISNYRHPSLHARKKSGENIYEARIDLHYRFTFVIENENIYVLTIGMHDAGLGKK